MRVLQVFNLSFQFSRYLTFHPLTRRYSYWIRSEFKPNRISCVQNQAVISFFGSDSNRCIGVSRTPYNGFHIGRTLTSDSKSGPSITTTVPVALISSINPKMPLKVLLVPINLFDGDDESIQKALSTLSALRESVKEIEGFPDKLTESSISMEPATNLVNIEKIEESENHEVLEDKKAQTLEKENQMEHDFENHTEQDQQPQRAENTQAEIMQANDSQGMANSEPETHIVTTVPESLEEALKNMSISSMQLSFDMSMTNLKDAIARNVQSENEDLQIEPPANDPSPSVELNAKCIDMTTHSEKTVPLNLNALIQGTVQVDPTQLSIEDLNNMGVTEFNEHITTIAANICSTALQKKFAPAEESQTTHFAKSTESDEHTKDEKVDEPTEKTESSQNEPPKVMSMKTPLENETLKPSEFIVRSGAYGLMSPDTYEKALRAAEKLRETSMKANRKQRMPISMLNMPIEDKLMPSESSNMEQEQEEHDPDTKIATSPSGAKKETELGTTHFSNYSFFDNKSQEMPFTRYKSKYENKKSKLLTPPKKSKTLTNDSKDNEA